MSQRQQQQQRYHTSIQIISLILCSCMLFTGTIPLIGATNDSSSTGSGGELPYDRCPELTTCDACQADEQGSCGFCSTSHDNIQSGSCSAGTARNPISPNTCASTVAGGSLWHWRSCRPADSYCWMKLGCRDCTNTPSCGWCRETNTCIDGSSVPFTMAQCPKNGSYVGPPRMIAGEIVVSYCPAPNPEVESDDDDIFTASDGSGGIASMTTLAISPVSDSVTKRSQVALAFEIILSTAAIMITCYFICVPSPRQGTKANEVHSALWGYGIHCLSKRVQYSALLLQLFLVLFLLLVLVLNSFTSISTHNQTASFGVASAQVRGGGGFNGQEKTVAYGDCANPVILPNLAEQSQCLIAEVGGILTLIFVILALLAASISLLMISYGLIRRGGRDFSTRLCKFSGLCWSTTILALFFWSWTIHLIIQETYENRVLGEEITFGVSWALLIPSIIMGIFLYCYWRLVIQLTPHIAMTPLNTTDDGPIDPRVSLSRQQSKDHPDSFEQQQQWNEEDGGEETLELGDMHFAIDPTGIRSSMDHEETDEEPQTNGSGYAATSNQLKETD